MLTDLKKILIEHRKDGTAIGSFNTPNLESIRAVIDGAEALNVPVIIAHAQLHENVAPLDVIGPIMIDCAKRAKVPVCVHLDHGEDFDYVKRAADMGFGSIMFDGSQMGYDQNKAETKRATEYAHGKGASVEAELGRLATREGGASGAGAEYTDENLVGDFIAATGIDALAIAFGTAHGFYATPPVLNLDVISKVKSRTDIPLVMHGGSGIDDATYREVIKRGIAKINFYSYMAYDGFYAAKNLANKNDKLFYHELSDCAYKAMKATVLKTLKVFGNK